MKCVSVDRICVDDDGVSFRLKGTSLKAFQMIRNIVEKTKRPTKAFGGICDNEVYGWIIVPLIKLEKPHFFNNDPPKKRKPPKTAISAPKSALEPVDTPLDGE
jgi:hypothetical protein